MTVVVFALLYVATGSGLWLLTALGLQLQMLQQLIPVVRFDGYYILSDLAGIPDLFARVGPVLRSLRPGQPPDPRVTELRPRARRFVTGWVLVVVPLLTAALVWTIWHLPDFVAAGRRRHPAAATGLRPGLGAPRLGCHGPGRRVDRTDPGPAGRDDGRALANRRHARHARARAGRGLGPREGAQHEHRALEYPAPRGRATGRPVRGGLHRRDHVRRAGSRTTPGLAPRRLPEQRPPPQPGSERGRAATCGARATVARPRSRARDASW